MLFQYLPNVFQSVSRVVLKSSYSWKCSRAFFEATVAQARLPSCDFELFFIGNTLATLQTIHQYLHTLALTLTISFMRVCECIQKKGDGHKAKRGHC